MPRSISDPTYEDGGTAYVLVPKTRSDATKAMKLDNLQDIIAYDTPEKDLIVENIEEEYDSEYDEEDLLSEEEEETKDHSTTFQEHTSSVFIAPGGKLMYSGYETKEEQVMRQDRVENSKLKTKMESKDIPEYEVDPEMLRIMEAAENSDIGSDFDYEEEEVDESKYEIKDNEDYELTALDQFLIDANKEPDYSFNLGAHIANLLSQIDDDDYGEEDELFVEDNKHSYQQSQDIHEKRDIDKHFDVVIHDYSDDQIGEGDEVYGHIEQDNPLLNDILDEFIQEHTQDRDFFKTLDQGKVDEQGHYLNEEEQRKNIPTKPLIERLIEKSIAEPEVVVPKTDQELAEEPSLEEETEDFSYLDMPTKRDDDGFDVESICSTYSNLENHPTIIQTKRKPKIIKLSKKTGLPLRNQDEEVDTEEEDMKEEEEEEAVELPTVITKRNKNETKEEKKQRKAAAKEAQRLKREQKKQLKNKYKEEEQKILRNPKSSNTVYSLN